MSRTTFRPTGYHTPTAYIGFLPNGQKMRFASESDYLDYLNTDEDD